MDVEVDPTLRLEVVEVFTRASEGSGRGDLGRCRRDNRPHAEPARIPTSTFRKPLSFTQQPVTNLVPTNSANFYDSIDTKNIPIGGDLAESCVGQVRHSTGHEHVRAWESQFMQAASMPHSFPRCQINW